MVNRALDWESAGPPGVAVDFLSDPAYIPFHHLGATPYPYCKPPHPSLAFTKLDLST